MNILLCGASMGIGGAETHMLTLARGLLSEGHRVTVAAERGELCSELKRLGIRFVRIPASGKGLKDTRNTCRILYRILRRWDFDVVHAHSRLTALLIALLRQRSGLCFRFVVTAHAKYKTSPLLRLLSVWGDECIAVSRDIKLHLLKNYGVGGGRIRVIPNGIDTSVFHPSGKGQRRSVLFVSRLDKDCSKGALALCRIAPELCREFPEAHITLVGGGSELSLVSALAERANRAVGRECVSVLGARRDVEELIRESECVVGVSRVALEALAMEKTVILFGNEGALGLFDESKLKRAESTNFTCRGHGDGAGDEFLFSELKRAFTLNDGVRRRIRRFGRDIVEEKYSAEVMVKKTLDVYNSVGGRAANVTIGGYYGFGNMGDDGALSILIACLKEMMPDARITVLTERGCPVSGVEGVRFADRSNILGLFRVLFESDVYISGGGSLLQNKTSDRSLLYYCGLLWLARKLGNVTVIMSNGIGPLRGRLAERMVERALTSARHVSVRDMDSFLKVAALTKGRVTPRLSADIVFSLENNMLNVGHGDGKSLLECGARYAAVALNGGEGKKNERLACALAEYCHAHKIFPVFVSMDPKRDEASARRCARISGGIYLKAQGVSELRALLRHSVIAVGSRLHFLIFALLEGVPFVPIFSDPKVDSFALEVLGTAALRIKGELPERLERFVSRGFCEYDREELISSFRCRARADLEKICLICTEASKENYAKALEKKKFICYN